MEQTPVSIWTSGLPRVLHKLVALEPECERLVGAICPGSLSHSLLLAVHSEFGCALAVQPSDMSHTSHLIGSARSLLRHLGFLAPILVTTLAMRSTEA